MALLDGFPKSIEEIEKALALVEPGARAALDDPKLTPKQRSVFKLMSEGMSLGDIMGLTKAHRDALLVYAGRTLQAGDVEKASSLLEMICRLEPFDARPIYLLAVIRQQQGRLDVAAQLYVAHLALDATNHDAHHRLGECFMAGREYGNAAECFGRAKSLAEAAGAAEAAARAGQMQSLARERLAAG